MPREKRDGSVESRFDVDRMKRVAAGIWKDRKTGRKVAGGAYDADTGAGRMMRRAIRKGEEAAVMQEELEKAQKALEEEE